MKKLLLTMLLFFAPAISHSYEQQLEFRWTYANPPTDLAGFKIYQDGALIATITDPAATVLLGRYNVTGGPQLYEISAFDKGGSESKKSAPYPFDPPPGSVDSFSITVR